jgi:hypothetical protein
MLAGAAGDAAPVVTLPYPCQSEADTAHPIVADSAIKAITDVAEVYGFETL